MQDQDSNHSAEAVLQLQHTKATMGGAGMNAMPGSKGIVNMCLEMPADLECSWDGSCASSTSSGVFSPQQLPGKHSMNHFDNCGSSPIAGSGTVPQNSTGIHGMQQLLLQRQQQQRQQRQQQLTQKQQQQEHQLAHKQQQHHDNESRRVFFDDNRSDQQAHPADKQHHAGATSLPNWSHPGAPDARGFPSQQQLRQLFVQHYMPDMGSQQQPVDLQQDIPISRILPTPLQMHMGGAAASSASSNMAAADQGPAAQQLPPPALSSGWCGIQANRFSEMSPVSLTPYGFDMFRKVGSCTDVFNAVPGRRLDSHHLADIYKDCASRSGNPNSEATASAPAAAPADADKRQQQQMAVPSPLTASPSPDDLGHCSPAGHGSTSATPVPPTTNSGSYAVCPSPKIRVLLKQKSLVGTFGGRSSATSSPADRSQAQQHLPVASEPAAGKVDMRLTPSSALSAFLDRPGVAGLSTGKPVARDISQSLDMCPDAQQSTFHGSDWQGSWQTEQHGGGSSGSASSTGSNGAGATTLVPWVPKARQTASQPAARPYVSGEMSAPLLAIKENSESQLSGHLQPQPSQSRLAPFARSSTLSGAWALHPAPPSVPHPQQQSVAGGRIRRASMAVYSPCNSPASHHTTTAGSWIPRMHADTQQQPQLQLEQQQAQQAANAGASAGTGNRFAAVKSPQADTPASPSSPVSAPVNVIPYNPALRGQNPQNNGVAASSPHAVNSNAGHLAAEGTETAAGASAAARPPAAASLPSLQPLPGGLGPDAQKPAVLDVLAPPTSLKALAVSVAAGHQDSLPGSAGRPPLYQTPQQQQQHDWPSTPGGDGSTETSSHRQQQDSQGRKLRRCQSMEVNTLLQQQPAPPRQHAPSCRSPAVSMRKQLMVASPTALGQQRQQQRLTSPELQQGPTTSSSSRELQQLLLSGVSECASVITPTSTPLSSTPVSSAGIPLPAGIQLSSAGSVGSRMSRAGHKAMLPLPAFEQLKIGSSSNNSSPSVSSSSNAGYSGSMAAMDGDRLSKDMGSHAMHGRPLLSPADAVHRSGMSRSSSLPVQQGFPSPLHGQASRNGSNSGARGAAAQLPSQRSASSVSHLAPHPPAASASGPLSPKAQPLHVHVHAAVVQPVPPHSTLPPALSPFVKSRLAHVQHPPHIHTGNMLVPGPHGTVHSQAGAAAASMEAAAQGSLPQGPGSTAVSENQQHQVSNSLASFLLLDKLLPAPGRRAQQVLGTAASQSSEPSSVAAAQQPSSGTNAANSPYMQRAHSLWDSGSSVAVDEQLQQVPSADGLKHNTVSHVLPVSRHEVLVQDSEWPEVLQRQARNKQLSSKSFAAQKPQVVATQKPQVSDQGSRSTGSNICSTGSQPNGSGWSFARANSIADVNPSNPWVQSSRKLAQHDQPVVWSQGNKRVGCPGWPSPVIVSFAQYKGRLGYLLSSGLVGVVYEDSTHMFMHPEDGWTCYHDSCSGVRPTANAASAEAATEEAPAAGSDAGALAPVGTADGSATVNGRQGSVEAVASLRPDAWFGSATDQDVEVDVAAHVQDTATAFGSDAAAINGRPWSPTKKAAWGAAGNVVFRMLPLEGMYPAAEKQQYNRRSGDQNPDAAPAGVPQALALKARCLRRFVGCLLQRKAYTANRHLDLTKLPFPILPAKASQEGSATAEMGVQGPLHAGMQHLRGFVHTEGCLLLRLTDGSHELVFTEDNSVMLLDYQCKQLAYVTRARHSKGIKRSSNQLTGSVIVTVMPVSDNVPPPVDPKLLARTAYASRLIKVLKPPASWLEAAAGVPPNGVVTPQVVNMVGYANQVTGDENVQYAVAAAQPPIVSVLKPAVN